MPCARLALCKPAMRAFAEPLPIDDVLPRARFRAQRRDARGAGRAARRRQDDARSAGAARRSFRRRGKFVVLEPRRLAARAAAQRMAWTLGEKVGETIGLRVRLQSLVSARTRIEVVTEGVFARMILDDPGARRNRRRAVRRIPRTLARRRSRPRAGARRAGGLARRPAAPRHVGDARRRARRARCSARAADRERGPRLCGRDALCRARPARARRRRSRRGDLRARSPRSAARSSPSCPARARSCASPAARRAHARPDVDIAPLYGAMDARAQDRAVAPAPPGRRKIVLATSIAETSLTIEGVRSSSTPACRACRATSRTSA